MNITELAIKKNVVTLLLAFMVLIAGYISYTGMEKAEDPPYQVKVAAITVKWPGATAYEMAKLVSDPIEEVVQDMEELKNVESKNLPGEATIYVNIE